MKPDVGSTEDLQAAALQDAAKAQLASKIAASETSANADSDEVEQIVTPLTMRKAELELSSVFSGVRNFLLVFLSFLT